MLSCERLDIAIPRRTLVAGLELTANAGEFVAVLGTNGAGKTLTLHTLAGLRAHAGGSVRVDGRELASWARRDLARRLSLLPQSAEDPFPTTALEAVLVGRHPHLGFWQWEGPDDIRIAREALAVVDLAAIEGRSVESLSGGERRRLAIAALLAQDPAICLLDEPTNHLDPHHQIDTLALFRARADRGGLVVATLHDATLAARFADRVLLLFGDGEWLYGGTGEVLTAGNLSRLYRSEIHEIAWRNRRVFVS